MNAFAIGSFPHRNGFLGYFRRVHRATNEILKDTNGTEIIFPSKAEAKAAAADELCRYLNGSMVCTGPMPSKRDVRRQAAERQFNDEVNA